MCVASFPGLPSHFCSLVCVDNDYTDAEDRYRTEEQKTGTTSAVVVVRMRKGERPVIESTVTRNIS